MRQRGMKSFPFHAAKKLRTRITCASVALVSKDLFAVVRAQKKPGQRMMASGGNP